MSETGTVDIKADYGALLIGGLLAFGLSGCVNMQFIVFWQVYSREQWTTKSLVIVVWLLDLCHSVFVAVAIWDSIIVSYGDLERVDFIPWSVGPTVELTAMVTFLVQSFCAYRIYRLQNRKWMVASLVFALAFMRLLAATVSTAEILMLNSYDAFLHSFSSWVFTLGLALSSSADLVITTSICYSLRSNRSLIPSTNRIIDNLTFWTVQNGSITFLAAIASLVCWTVMPYNRIYLGLHFIIGKLYANSLLATLNARQVLRNPRKYSPTPLAAASDNVFGDGDEQDGPANQRRRGPYTRHVDPFKLEPLNFGNSKSIEVNVEQMVVSKYDGEVLDVVSPTSKSKHGTQEA